MDLSGSDRNGLKINIGCGSTPIEGYINIDNSPLVVATYIPGLVRVLAFFGLLEDHQVFFSETIKRWKIRFANCHRRIPFPDDSVDLVYGSHMFEHLDRQDARNFLREVRRVLRVGGALRLAIPDLAVFVQTYKGQGDADWFIDRLCVTAERPRGVWMRIRAALVGPRHHLWMYDCASVKKLLSESGFADVVCLPPGETRIDKPGAIDLREREDESLYVEARLAGDRGGL